MRADYLKLRDRVLAGLKTIPGITCTVPEGAFYVYPKCVGIFRQAGFADRARTRRHGCCMRAHVVTVPGEAFGTKSISGSLMPSLTRMWMRASRG